MLKILRGIPPKTKDALVAIDLETFGVIQSRMHRPYGELALAAFCIGEISYVVDNVADLKKAWNNVKTNVLVFHKAEFDIPHLRRWVSFPSRPGTKLWDTLLIDKILWSGYYDEFSLKDCVRRELGILMDKEARDEFKGERVEITKKLVDYNGKDAYYTRLLALKQMEHMQARPYLFKVWNEIDCPAMFALLDMQGFKINEKRWLEIAEEHGREAEKIAVKLGFNPGSWQQVAEVGKQLGLKLKNTREQELEKFKDDPVIAQVLQYRFHAKRHSAYGQNFLDRLMEADHRIYASYNTIGAVTGRMASGMQQVPARDSPIYRECFVAEKGHSLIIADYKAQEPKLLAQISRDGNLITIFLNHQDIHLIVCRVVLKDDTINKGDKRMVAGQLVNARNEVGKVVNLASSYGMTSLGLALKLGIEIAAAQLLLNEYFRRFPGVKAYIDEMRRLARLEHKVQTLGGRDCWINPYNHKGENNAINSPIQGSAADVIKLAIALLHAQCLSMRTVFPVVAIIHDEIVLEVATREAKKWARLLKECMTNAITQLAPDICHDDAVDIYIGSSWAEKK